MGVIDDIYPKLFAPYTKTNEYNPRGKLLLFLPILIFNSAFDLKMESFKKNFFQVLLGNDVNHAMMIIHKMTQPHTKTQADRQTHENTRIDTHTYTHSHYFVSLADCFLGRAGTHNDLVHHSVPHHFYLQMECFLRLYARHRLWCYGSCQIVRYLHWPNDYVSHTKKIGSFLF